MPDISAVSRPLPGVRFAPRPPRPADALPRMDVAMFVGFAASGPVDRPVAVVDMSQFVTVFGDDAPLAWDAARGELVIAHLASAVRAFFRNGGRRCWVVRVAEDARSNVFPLPGIARLEGGRLTPAFARARSPGSWSDGLRVGTALEARPVELRRVGADLASARLAVAAHDVARGDVVRLTFTRGAVDARTVLTATFAIAEVEAANEESPPSGRPDTWVRGVPRDVVWLSSGAPAGLDGRVATARTFAAERPRQPSPAEPTPEVVVPGDFESAAVTVHGSPPVQALGDALYAVELELPIDRAPSPGALVRVDVRAAGQAAQEPSDELWLVVHAIGLTGGSEASDDRRVRVTGRGWWRLRQAPDAALLTAARAELLALTLATRLGDSELRRSGLGLATSSPRCWNALPPDAERYRPPGDGSEDVIVADSFPLAGDGTKATLWVPIDVGVQLDALLGPATRAGTTLERDGLHRFDASLFLDPALAESGIATMAAAADFQRYEREPARPLRGIHTAFDLEEVTIIAVPDAVHRGWSPEQAPPTPATPPSAPPVRPEWWPFRDCHDDAPLPAVSQPEWGHFLPCRIRVIAAPTFVANAARVLTLPASAGAFTLEWSAPEGERFIVEESTDPAFAPESSVVHDGPARRVTLYGRRAGDFHYRVRALVAGQTSDWSPPLLVRLAAPAGWRVEPEADYASAPLLDVHRALLRLCATRGDALAVLALPEHYREADVLAHVAALRPPVRGATAVAPRAVPDDPQMLGYGALYHPWLVGREPTEAGPIRRIPPDGAACGIIARRTLERGAWIAPANEPMQGPFALNPRIAPTTWQALQDAQVNLVRQEPRGVLVLGADTLSLDPDLRPINVRRLLSLLRRAALRLGATYVFEPHDDAFRRLVRRGFEAMLDGMFLRGAFAGASASSAYQVVVSSSLNTRESADQGRFIVELRVAPALPLTFLTVRLVQNGERGVVTEVR